MAGDGKAKTKSLSNIDADLAKDAASQCPTNAITVG
jgi:ferredoxin